MNKLQRSLSGIPDDLRAMAAYCYANVAQSYLSATEGRRICYMIVAANGIVWAAWQVPRMQGFMMRSFTHHPLSGLSYTMLTSVFR